MDRRLFIALELPEAVREALASIREPLRHVRWVAPGNLHLTLAFLGDVESEFQTAIEDALSKVKIGRFVLSVAGVGTFGRNRPKVIWSGVGTAHPHLFALRKKVLDAALATGIEPDMRSFHPHVTIARVDGASAESLKPFLKRHAGTDFGLARMTTFTLFSSTLDTSGARHRVENRWNLDS